MELKVYSEELKGFIRLLGFNTEEEDYILAHILPQETLFDLYNKMKTSKDEFLSSLDDPKENLSIFTQLAYLCHEKYQKQGISDEVFFATMKDIALWTEDYRRRNGSIGLAETSWLVRHLNLTLFCLGSLQFEVVEDDKDPYPSYNGCTIAVHIPAGADISSSAVEDSFAKALTFFGKSEIRFICSSWLLSKELSSLLDEKSNIKTFAQKFTIIASDRENKQAEERIFGSVLEDKTLYPCKTSLQQKAKTFLLEGGRLPLAYGFLFRFSE